jgi:hypothetical protein
VEAVMSIVRSILAGDAAAFEQARRIWERLR